MRRFLFLLAMAAMAPGFGLGADLALESPPPVAKEKEKFLYAPEFDRSTPALSWFKLENNWETNSPEDYLTFGEAFPSGALQPGEKIAARYGDVVLPAQLDVMALHDDGSVRHAAVTVATPGMKSGKSIDGAIIKTESNGESDFNVRDHLDADYAFPLSLTFYFADETTREFSIDVRDLLLKAVEASVSPWLNGPLVKEYRVTADAAPHLQLRFDIRIYRDGDIRTSAIFANEKTFSGGIRNNVYDVSIGPKATPAFTASRVGHHRASVWRRIFWTGSQPKLQVVHDTEGLAKAGAILPLDVSLGVLASVIAQRDVLLRNLPPLSPALIHRYMPSPGGRPDIGLYPQWTAHYLATQSEAAKRVMLEYAEAAGAVPWHFRDEKTNAPVSIEDHPKFWADERGLEPQYAPDRPHPDVFASSDGGWTPDHSHKPSLVAIPWLVTADRYYADELAMQAAWAVFGRWPDLREGGLKVIDVEQVRASAWSLRDLSDAAFLLPDAHRSKAYLKRALKQNLSLARKKYVTDRAMRSAGELEGYFEELIEADPERISPWQNDYMALALGLAAARGEKDAEHLLAWSGNFHSGRYLNPDFDPAYAAAYRFPAKEAPELTPLSSWAQLSNAIREHGNMQETELKGYPELGYGYFASAYAALVVTASQAHTAASYEGLAAMLRQSRNAPLWSSITTTGVRRHNQFLFAMTFVENEFIDRDHIRYGKSGSDENDLLIGEKGSDKLDGDAGADALFGFEGNDRIDGGKGDDLISGGAGDDVLTGDDGRDIFSYTGNDSGIDRITDFNPAEDIVQFDPRIFSEMEEILDALNASPEGSRLVFPEGKGAIVFIGLRAPELSPDNFKIQ